MLKEHEKLLSELTQRLFLVAERHGVNKEVVNRAVSDLRYIFSKDPEKKENWCLLCQQKREKP